MEAGAGAGTRVGQPQVDEAEKEELDGLFWDVELVFPSRGQAVSFCADGGATFCQRAPQWVWSLNHPNRRRALSAHRENGRRGGGGGRCKTPSFWSVKRVSIAAFAQLWP